MKEKLYEIIERDKEELFDLLGSLIRINSENYGDYGNEIECAEYIKKYCEDLGYGAEVYSPLEICMAVLQYLPAGLCLAWSYAKADTIFAPILIHAAVNYITINGLR